MYKLLLIACFTMLTACGRSAPEPVGYSGAVRTFHNGIYPRFSDERPFEWQGIRPGQYPIHGIDISKYQGDVDWLTVKRSGVSFAYIKATEGGDHLDEKFSENWRNAGRASIARGAYHFYFFCRTAAEQARWFIDNVPRDRNALPPVLDIEWNHQSKNCPGKPSPIHIRNEMTRFISIITAHYGRRPLIYTTVDFFADNQIGRVRGADFWLRSVAGHPSETYPGQAWTLWQYSGTGNVDGIKGKVDLNVFAGSPDAWNSWIAYLRQ